MSARPPNILLLMVDQLAACWLPAYGNPVVQAPNLTGLARDGVVFEAGKMHFVGPDQLYGFEERLTTDVYPADLIWTPDWQRPVAERLPWYHTMESVLRPGVREASMQLDYDAEVTFQARRRIFDLARERSPDPFFRRPPSRA